MKEAARAALPEKILKRLPFKRIYVSPEGRDLPGSRRALERLSFLPVFQAASHKDIPAEHKSGETLFITSTRGEAVGSCPGSRGHVCCNYLTVDVYIGCSLGCSYCIMKSYLNFEPVTVYADTATPLRRIREIAAANQDRLIRVGSGETGDSLQLDPVFELSAEFIRGLADLPNVMFESKTKTDFVDHLLAIPDKGKAVIAFSLNAEGVFRSEEEFAATPGERLAAARKAVEAGYFTAFHFDPIIGFPGWEAAYGEIIDRLAEFPARKVAWISLGTFRYPPALKDRIGQRPYLFDEFVPCRDGKYRYIQRRRRRIYAWFLDALRKTCDAPVYLCMESADIWRKVYGKGPMANPRTRDLFHAASFEEKPAELSSGRF
ncbi:MAG: radical SAM protein [Spirochaetales bacterium]|jgi:spore photoproduct lyase|nr:radical SAM protein [Spirochaetales bacterium]